VSTEAQLQRCVDRGMERLDMNRPGWEWQVDLDHLSIEDGQHCVLGQVFGRYTIGLVMLGINVFSSIGYGFAALEGNDYTILDRLWRESILARRAAAQPKERRADYVLVA